MRRALLHEIGLSGNGFHRFGGANGQLDFPGHGNEEVKANIVVGMHAAHGSRRELDARDANFVAVHLPDRVDAWVGTVGRCRGLARSLALSLSCRLYRAKQSEKQNENRNSHLSSLGPPRASSGFSCSGLFLEPTDPGADAFINLLFGLKAHIDNMAHLGGLVTGLLMGFFLARTFNLAPEERPAKRKMIFVYSAILLLALFVPVAKAKQYAVEFAQGEAALDHNDLNAAIAHLQKYVADRPDDAIGHALLGSAFQQAERLDEAAREFERSLAIEPDYPYAQVSLARIYAYQKKTDKALELFAKGMPDVEPQAPAFYLYAIALRDAGKLPDAESKVRRAIQLDPKYTHAHKLLAEILALEGRKDEAAAEQKRVEELSVDARTPSASK